MEDTTTYSVRLPNPLRDALKQTALEDRRSLHGQLLHLVEIGLQVRATTGTASRHAANENHPLPPVQPGGATLPASAR